MSNKPSHFIWYELMTSDVDAAAKFYGAVVGWTVQPSGQPGMDYRMWQSAGEGVGGLLAIDADAKAGGMQPAWLPYVDVADVDEGVAAIKAAGGASHMAADIPGVGRIAMVTDPQGAAFYVMKPIGEGQSTVFSPGRLGHRGWNELHAKDGSSAWDFYRARLGWDEAGTFDMGPMGTYRTFSAGGGEAIGGMMTSPGFDRPMWLSYVNVDDIDAAKARVEAAGGEVTTGPHEVPTGEWMIQARDPQGALFGLLGPKKA
jgi:predicted enzyme related to lactoylglutathione lyase